MWLVRLAIRRPHVSAVLSVLLLFFGMFSAARMRTDILPSIDIPVALVVWNYPGLPAEEMEKRLVVPSERSYSMTVNGLSHIESKSITGVGLLKLYFEPGSDLGAAISQITSVSSTAMRNMPPGTHPPIIMPYNASNVPVAQLTVSGPNHPEEELVDFAYLTVRMRLFTVPGLATPAPYGGKAHQINIDVDQAGVASRGISVQEVLDAILESNPPLPGGVARLGATSYDVTLNNTPTSMDELKRVVVKSGGGGAPVLLGQVANVYEGTEAQDSIVRVNGKRATYLAIVRKSNASTLAVVDAAKEMLPMLRKSAPAGMELTLNFDQSIFVRAAMSGVLRETAMAALLVTMLILVALGSVRSVVIVAISIPLSLCAALIGLAATGQTLNVMTLGGLSLAIGMLVDDATVEVENIHRNVALGKPLRRAVVDGARQIAMPTLAATLCICVVFFPVVLLEGPARFLFIPLALSVVFAMLASYGLSRTLVPTLACALLDRHGAHHRARDRWARLNAARESGLARLQEAYGRFVATVLRHKSFVLGCGLVGVAIVGVLALDVGADVFPEVDTGQMRLHVRAPLGTRLEETEQLLAPVEQQIRETVGPGELETISDTIGLPTFFNIAFVQTDSIGSQDAELLISLGHPHRPVAEYRRLLRERLRRAFPNLQFYFQPADIISQVLNFGASAPIDVEIVGKKLDDTAKLARLLRDRVKQVPGTIDVRVAQSFAHPSLRVNVDRERAAALGISQRDVATSVLTSLSSSGLVAPSYWINPENNVSYLVAVQAPQDMTQIAQLRHIPITGLGRLSPAQPDDRPVSPELSDVAKVQLSQSNPVIDHDNVERVVDVQCGVEGRDLNSVTRDIERLVAELGPLPAGVRTRLRGQSETLTRSFRTLALGLGIAMLLAYLVMVVLFRSWFDPLVAMAAIPSALAGVLLALAVTRTTLNVESFMGSIMAVGLAVSNSILLVSFIKEVQHERHLPLHAAVVEAARTRLRPVLMTASAMILGMIPMAVGFGEAGEQNAPLGRAVIGGILGATFSTLVIVPALYAGLSALLRRDIVPHHLQLEDASDLIA